MIKEGSANLILTAKCNFYDKFQHFTKTLIKKSKNGPLL